MKPTVPFCSALAALVILLGAIGTASGDVFLLVHGGRIVGDLVNRDELPRKKYIVQVADGVKVTLEAGQVQKVLRPRADEAEYERIAPTYPDTVAGQWELAQWCRDHRLSAQREAHLRRVIELEPNHAEARRALGYSRIDGQWTTQDELMTKQGRVKYKGQWKYPQEIEILENKRKLEQAQQEWCQKVKRWRGWLGTDRRDQARQNIHGINDPAAVKALTIGLNDDRDPHARMLFVEPLMKIGTFEAAVALAWAAIYDEVEEVRLTCLDNLQTKPRPEVVRYFVGKLRDKDNTVVNRAAVGLGRMRDPSAIGPLIDAVWTTHTYKVVNPAGDNSTSASFGGGPGNRGTGLSMGGGPKYIKRQIPNQCVLDALVSLTHRNFNFDKQAWKYWYAAQKKSPEAIDARRD